MTLPDETIALSFELLTECSLDGIEKAVKKDSLSEKKRLAFEIVKLLWGETSAISAQQSFEKTFQKKSPEFKKEISARKTLAQTISQVIGSVSEAKRLISQGAVDVSGTTIFDPTREITSGEEIKIGKKIFIKVK